MNKIISIIIVIIVIGGGVFLYMTRPVAVPTENIQDQVVHVTTDDTAAAGTQLAGSDTSRTYRIGSGSSATFSINEVLNDKPKNAVGTTSQIAGEIKVSDNDVQNMHFLTLGTVKIDARTFKTDSEKRDGAIVRFILNSETAGNEYIAFTPTAKSISFTDGEEFSIAGNLTISGVTKPVTFKVTATATEEKVTGKATATIKRTDFGLKIPQVESVASVDDSFVLSADIVATQK